MTLALVGMSTEVALWPTRVASAAPPGGLVEVPLDGIGIIEDPTDPPPPPADPVGPILFGDFDANGDGEPDRVFIRDPDQDINTSRAAVVSGADNTIIFVVSAPDNSRRLQKIASSAGDVNGDGVSDLMLLSVPTGATAPEDQRLEILVYSGATGDLLRTHFSSTLNDAFGVSAAPIGDIDGDGHDDIAIGAPTTGLDMHGRIYIYSGQSGQVLRVHNGIFADSLLGESVAGLGDVNGDGCPDYAAGAPSSSNTAGRVMIYDGATGSVIRTLVGAPNAAFGARLAALPDTNGNGIPDLAISAPGEGAALPDSIAGGIIRIYDGANGNMIRMVTGDADYAFDISMTTTESDQDGDGAPELLIAAQPAADPMNPEAMVLYILSPLTGEVLGSATVSDFTSPATIRTDLNHDGRTDSDDIMLWTVAIESGSGGHEELDLDGDGEIGMSDLLAILNKVQQTDAVQPQLVIGDVGDLCAQSAGLAGAIWIGVHVGCAFACGVPYLLGPYFGYGVLACGYCAYAGVATTAAANLAIVGCGVDFVF